MWHHINRFWFMTFLVTLATLGFFASDMYLPAFPTIQDSLHTSIANVELTLSIYLIGFAPGQIIYGIVSDRIGRKGALVFGVGLFMLASLGCFYSHSIGELWIWRAIQAFGVCAASVLWQAIVVDRYGQTSSHRIFGFIFPLLGVSPALAPTIGGLLTTALGWRSIFLTLCIVGLALFVLTILFFRETTSSVQRAKQPIRFSSILQNYKKLLTTPEYIGYVVLMCLAQACFFSYLTGSPFALTSVGFTTHEVGLAYIPQTFFFMLGGFLSKKLVDRWGSGTILKITIVCALACGLLLTGFGWNGFGNGTEIIVPFLLIAIANGMLYPTCMSIALNRFPEIAGTGAGLAGFLQAVVSAGVSSFVAALSAHGNANMAYLILILSVLQVIVFVRTQRAVRRLAS